MQKITPCLWFDGNAQVAARFYTAIFKNSKIKAVTRYGAAAAKASGRPKGSVMTVAFTLDGQEFLGLNGGPQFKFSPAISLMAHCQTQGEIDRLWKKLSAGGQEVECGWLTDKFGLSWQIIPADLYKMLQTKDARKLDRMMAAVVQMKKLDAKRLRAAFAG